MNARFVAPALLLAVFAIRADAQFINDTPTGLTSAASVLTFETNSGYFTAAGSQFGAQGVTFSSGAYVVQPLFTGAGGGSYDVGNNGDLNDGCDHRAPCTNPINIFFTTATHGAAVQFVSFGTATFTAFLDGHQVSTFSFAASLAGQTTPLFYGFDESVLLDQLQISDVSTFPEFGIDNLEYNGVAVATATPEPASFALALTGLLGVGLVGRRRRKA